MTWNHHCGARDESAGEPEESSQGALESAASTALPLRALPNSMKRLRCGRGFDRQHALLCQIYGILKYGASDTGHELAGSSPLLRLSGSDARPNVHWSPAAASGVDARHMEAGAPEATKKQLMACTGGRTSQTKSESLSYDHHGDNLRKQTRAAVKHAAQSEPQETGKQRRKGQSSRAKPSGSRPSSCWTSSASRSCTTLPAKSERVACVFCIDFLFFRGTRGHKICQREDRHSLRPSHCKAASDPDARQAAPPARCDRHEARAGIVALKSGSALEIWAFLVKSLSLPMCTKQTTCRGAAPASRLDPLALRGDTRGRSKALIFAMLNGASFTDPEPLMFSRNPENLRTKTSGTTAKATISASIRFLARTAAVPIARVASCTRERQHLAALPPNPRLASEFIGDIRPLNSREKSIGRVHLPYPDARSWASHRQCRLQFEPPYTVFTCTMSLLHAWRYW